MRQSVRLFAQLAKTELEVAITRVNQVWSSDITYNRLSPGFAYLVAIIDRD